MVKEKSKSLPRFGGIILAAGASSRMGQPKALLPYQGTFFIDRILDNLSKAGCSPVIPVLGNDTKRILDESRVAQYPFVQNPRPQAGMLSSVKRGLQQVPADCLGVILALVDHPFVETTTYKQLLHVASQHTQEIIIPQYRGKHGHPVFAGRFLFEEILSAPDGSSLRDIFTRHNDVIQYLVVDDVGVVRDVDTPQAYARWAK